MTLKQKKERFISILELQGTRNYGETSIYLKELLENYNHIADVIIDIYTHDDKEYRLSNLDGIVKLEQLDKNKKIEFKI